MKRFIAIAPFVTAAILYSLPANAGIAGSGGKWLSGEILSIVLSAALAIAGGAFGLLFSKVTRTFREAGEFLTVLGTALDDRRLTREELAAIIREGREIFTVWR